MSDKNPDTPPEALILFAMIAMIFGGTVLLNIIISAIFFQ